MDLQSITNINVDFYDKKYILINAKQFDKKSRFLSITCYNHGEPCYLNESKHSAYVRYRKSDNNSVFNSCEIDRKGDIIVELTEQMLAVGGVCCAELVVVNEGNAKVNSQTGEIIGIENSSILSTMPIHIDVTETAVENSDIESSYEFNGFNTALEKAEAEYTEVIKTSKSWAVGETGVRNGENTDNSKYYAKQSLKSAGDSAASAANAANSEGNANYYYELIKDIVVGLDTGFIPMGTISFAELANTEKATGYVYNINDDFVTDDTFREGAGKQYTAGTNVYYTASGKWDCFGGANPHTASVEEVEDYLGI